MIEIQHHRYLIVALLALAGACSDDKPAVPYPPPAPGQKLEWQIGPLVNGINHSIGMPPAMTPRPDGGYEFTFPVAGGKVDYVTRTTTPTDGRTAIRMRYRIEGAGAGFVAVDGGVPAMVRLFIQRRGDTWAGQGPYASYRFWSAGQPLAEGEHILEGPITGWTNVQGQTDEAGLQAALADLGTVGYTFGSTSAGHGVYANSPGAKFVLVSYQ